MRTIRYTLAVLFATLLAVVSPVSAQDVTVTVTPIQSVLPPQLMLYVTDPGNYFNITLMYTGNKDVERVYLAMQAEQTNPSSGLSLTTPANRPSPSAIVLRPNQPYTLNQMELRSMFNHVPLNEIKAPQGLFDSYTNGSFGLLPEGQYEIHFTAYEWEQPTQANGGKIANPMVVSAPSGGYAYFNVCYRAQAPAFLTPMLPNQSQELVPLTVAELDPATPQFTWKAPLVACNPTAIQFTYSLRIVQVLPGQDPTSSMDHNPVVYQANQLTNPLCMIPTAVVKTMKQGVTYAAQLTATPSNANNRMLNYVSVENEGKSSYLLFRLKGERTLPGGNLPDDEDVILQPDTPPTTKDIPEDDAVDKADDKKDDGPNKDVDEDDEDDEESDISVWMGNTEAGAQITDSLYTFRNPRLIDPVFSSFDGVRKRFVKEGIEVSWEPAMFAGGEGTQPDTIKIEYDLELFDNGERANKEEAVKQEPIYKKHIKDLVALKDTIEWKDIEETAEAGDYMVLRVTPVLVNKKASVGFTGEDNVVDFALCNRLSRQYFQCSNMVEIEDTNPTEETAKDLKGKEVALGEYQMIIDEISGDAKNGFTGKGRVIWEPFGAKIKVSVKFEKLKINKNYIVYDGLAESYAEASLTSMQVVDKLFSDWGIDNLIGESGIPYADYLGQEAKDKAKSLGENINIGQYYSDIQKGKGVLELLTKGEMDNVHTPIKFPKEVFPKSFDVMDVQIAGMKFAPTYATMNVIAQSKLPECDVLKDKVLVFGAPRLCISPNRFLPESGHIALLGDFTLQPTSDFEMTFKSPADLITPKDGCYISWHDNKFELLGIDADLKIPGLVKDENGKMVKDEKGNKVHPTMNINMSIGSWNDFLAEVKMDDFQAEDLPGYTFRAQNVIFDLSDDRNHPDMGKFPEKYDKMEAGIKGQEEKWHGLYIKDIGVTFPKSFQFGDTGDKDGRLTIDAKDMFIDVTGVTVSMEAAKVFAAKDKRKGMLGGWGISLDKVFFQVIQGDFENCSFAGQLNVPLFDTNKDKDKFGNIDYTCEIRRLTDPRKNKQGQSERTRYSYMFLTEEVEDLDFSFLVAKATLDADQTYFVVDAYDHETIEDSIVTNVELCMGGKIGIGLVDKANDKLAKLTKDLPINVKIPDIHFTKMRLSNRKRGEWKTENERVKAKIKAREDAEAAVAKKKLITLMESNEMSLGGGAAYLDLGEWSLASAKKTIGPFSFSLDKFTPKYADSQIKVEVGGTLGLVGDKVCVSTTLEIAAKVNMKGTNLSNWSVDDGQIHLNDIGLDVDFAGALHLAGNLSIIRPGQGDGKNQDKGYKGKLTIDITGLFALDCEGGFFETTMTSADLKAMEAEANSGDDKDKADFASMDEDDKKKFSWGYFKISMESGAGIQAPPIAINRIAGGFFFNCTPTKGAGKFGKFSGDPVAKYGAIGVALGLGMSTSAGEKALRADLDVLVVYDNQNKCLSTFMFNGKMEAVGGMIKADCSLVYENEISAGKTQNRYLVLNVTVEAGMDTKGIMDQVNKANAQLESLKGKLDEFQGKIDGVYQKVAGATCGMKELSGKNGSTHDDNDPDTSDGDLSKLDTKNTADDKPTSDAGTAKEKTANKPGFSAGQTSISLEFKITWAKNGQTYNTPKWHLYLGEPEYDKRCSFTYLKIDAGIVKVDIGANAYICLGNELPNGGALPEIPSEIVDFLAGNKKDNTDMGADLGKAQRSRAAAAKALLDPNSCEGGVMVGASAWGKIDLDLGLLYGKMGAMAGFDCSLVNYGNSAFCMNSGSKMGKNGWYAMGQLYAYLYAELGLHIKIGRLINEKISFFNFGIGGVLEVGLPNPTWVEGQARVKISLLGGLAKINKKFEFSAGDRCIPFRGNALDGFEMVSSVNMGSDSLYQALMDPTYAISANEAKNMTFSTISSIGSHYRLLDPSYQDDIANKLEITEEEMKEKLALNASRTYVFDITQDRSSSYGKMGVRLFDLGTNATKWANGTRKPTEAEFLKLMGKTSEGSAYYSDMSAMVASNLYTREKTVVETTKEMDGRDITKGAKTYLNTDKRCQLLDYFLNGGALGKTMGIGSKTEKYCTFREDKGTLFHLTGMNVEPGHSYALFIQSDGYEIDNGKRVWCQYIDNGKEKHIQWRQAKVWYFRVKSNEEEKIVTDSLRNLQPYIALAYPSLDGTKVVDDRTAGGTKAYYNDIMHPTIALNRDIRDNLPASKMTWVLTPILGDTLAHQYAQTRSATYIYQNNCLNLEPSSTFGSYSGFNSAKNTAISAGKSYDYSTEQYQLQLRYKYTAYDVTREKNNRTGRYQNKYTNYRDSVFNLVDLRVISMPHSVSIKGTNYTDDWRTSTSQENSEVLPYSLPFVGARIYAHPKIDYEETMKTATDDDIVFYNKRWNGTPLRLLDPYLYFAYLGKWTFIGDRAVNAYDFDKAQIPFGTETLIYNYNGTTVNVEFLKNESAKSLWEVRNQMYDVWNTWYYNDSNQPYFPLPTLTKTVGGITTNNQDGKTSTVVPRNVNKFDDYTYCYEDLVHEYTAPWQLAGDMCKELKMYANELLPETYLHTSVELSDDDYKYDTYLGEAIAKYNNTYRGRYIEKEIRGFHVKVPYYQLPLIFGDCFGDKAAITYTNPSGQVKTWKPGSAGRTFKKTIGKDDMPSKVRWSSITSNLLFFRLTDWGTSAKSVSKPKWSWNKTLKKWDGDYSKMYQFKGHVWLKSSDSKWADSYKSSTTQEVPWDEFKVGQGLKAVSEFKVLMYRVDAYNLSTGLYTCGGSYSGGKHRGGGTWWVYETIGEDNKTATNLATMESVIEEKNEWLETHYDQPRPQCIYTFQDRTLTFIYSDEKEPSLPSGVDDSNGHLIMAEESDFEDHTWDKWKASIIRVKFDASFKKADIRSTKQWFYGFTKLKTIEGIGNLNTSKVETMEGMFWRCTALTTIDLRSWDVSKVKSLRYMFTACSALTQVDLSGWNLTECTNMYGMFQGCTALKTVYINIATPKVENMAYLFSGCENLYNGNGDLSWSSFGNSSELTNTSRMFWDCKRLKRIFLNGMSGVSVTNCSEMFNGCMSLTYLSISSYAPAAADVTCTNIFKSIKSSASAVINYALPDKIRDQWPGNKSQTYDTNIRAIHAQFVSGGQECLIFIRSDVDYKVGSNYTIVVNGTGRYVKVKAMWSGNNVLSTSTTPGWYKNLPNIEYVYIDSSFSASPQSTSYWFAEATKLKSIEGLENLNTTRTTRMNYMFHNCKLLKSYSMKFGKNFKTTKCTTIHAMFKGCEQVEEIVGLNQISSEVLTDIGYMFSGCKALKSINLGSNNYNSPFLTKKITSLDGMFYNCSNVERIYVYDGERFDNSIDASSATSLSSLFYGCGKCKDFPNVRNTEKVTDWSYMYYGCALFRTTNGAEGWFSVPYMTAAKNVNGMFGGCTGLKKLDLSTFDGTNVTSCSSMFYGCTGLQELNLTLFKPAKLSTYSSMFYGVPSTCTIYIPYDCSSYVLNQIANPPYTKRVLIYPAYALIYVVGNQKEMTLLSGSTKYAVGDTYNGYKIDRVITGTDLLENNSYYMGCMFDPEVTKVVIDASYARVPLQSLEKYFYGMKKMTSITGLQYLNTSNVTSTRYMFYNCGSLTSLNVSGLNTSNITDMSCMFMYQQLSNTDPESMLKSITFGGSFKTDKVEDMSLMFYGQKALTSLNISTFNTDNVKNVGMMFSGCRSLTSLTLGNFLAKSKIGADGNAGDGMMGLFDGCESLKSVNVSKFDMKNVTSLYGIFLKCSSLTEIDLSNWNTQNMKSMVFLFSGCTKLRTLTLGRGFSVGNLKKFDSTYEDPPFKDVHDLTVIVPSENLDEVKSAFVSGQKFVIGTTGQFYDRMPSKEAQVIWTASDKTLTFYYGASISSTFNGKKVTKVWKGNDVLANTSIQAPWINTVNGTVEKVVFDNSFINARPTSTKGWFYSFDKVKTVEGFSNLNTSNVTDMSYMFYRSLDMLKGLDLTTMNTARVTNMSNMFYYTKIGNDTDFSHFNTSNVTNMSNMFSLCQWADKLNLSSFNTNKVTNADKMFSTTSFKQMKLGQNFTFSSMSTKANNAFDDQRGGKLEIQVHSNYMSSVKAAVKNKLGFVEPTNGDFVELDKIGAQAIWTESNKTLTFFYGRPYKKGDTFAPNGKTVTAVWSGNDVTRTPISDSNAPWTSTIKDKVTTVTFHSSFKEAKPYSVSYWFSNCSKLTSVTFISNLNTELTYNFNYMFYNCTALRSLSLSDLKTPAATSMSGMFCNCSNLQNKLNLSNFDTSKVTYMSSMFYGCEKLPEIDLHSFKTNYVESFYCMFYNCKALKSLDLEHFVTKQVKNMSYMFYNCISLNSLSISTYQNWDTSNVTTMRSMFYNVPCGVSHERFKMGKVTDMSYMFYGYGGWLIDGSSWDVSQVTEMNGVFGNCKATDYRVGKWNVSNVTSMASMFAGCAARSLALNDWNVMKVTNFSYMFNGCTELTAVECDQWTTKNATTMAGMFMNCSKLTRTISDFMAAYNEKVKFTNWSTFYVTNMSYMFYNTALNYIDIRTFITQKVENFTGMFSQGGSSYRYLTVGPYFNSDMASNCTAFYGAKKVTVYTYATNNYTVIARTLKKLGLTDNKNCEFYKVSALEDKTRYNF